MEFNWNAKSYYEILNLYLGYRSARRPRGAIKTLAEVLSCHTTFISQVLAQRAHFSQEQGLKICRYFLFTSDERDFFMLLLKRDRAGTKELQDYYQEKINYLFEKRRDLSYSLDVQSSLNKILEGEYFSNWSYQAIHALTQIKKIDSIDSISKLLHLSRPEIETVLTKLHDMGLIVFQGGKWKCIKDSVHLPKESVFTRQHRITWKSKMLTDLFSKADMEGTRYVGVVTLSENDYLKARDVLVKALAEIRHLVSKSEAESAAVLSMDCYRLY